MVEAIQMIAIMNCNYECNAIMNCDYELQKKKSKFDLNFAIISGEFEISLFAKKAKMA